MKKKLINKHIYINKILSYHHNMTSTCGEKLIIILNDIAQGKNSSLHAILTVPPLRRIVFNEIRHKHRLLIHAITYNNTEAMQLLFKYYYSVTNPINIEPHPLHYAIKHRYPETVKLLLDSKYFDPSSNNNIAIRIASQKGYDEIVTMLLNDDRVDPSDKSNDSLIQAITGGLLSIVKLLLSHPKIDPSARNNHALKTAVRWKRLDIINELINHKQLRCINFDINKYLEKQGYIVELEKDSHINNNIAELENDQINNITELENDRINYDNIAEYINIDNLLKLELQVHFKNDLSNLCNTYHNIIQCSINDTVITISMHRTQQGVIIDEIKNKIVYLCIKYMNIIKNLQQILFDNNDLIVIHV